MTWLPCVLACVLVRVLVRPKRAHFGTCAGMCAATSQPWTFCCCVCVHMSVCECVPGKVVAARQQSVCECWGASRLFWTGWGADRVTSGSVGRGQGAGAGVQLCWSDGVHACAELQQQWGAQ